VSSGHQKSFAQAVRRNAENGLLLRCPEWPQLNFLKTASFMKTASFLVSGAFSSVNPHLAGRNGASDPGLASRPRHPAHPFSLLTPDFSAHRPFCVTGLSAHMAAHRLPAGNSSPETTVWSRSAVQRLIERSAAALQ